ncbi:hypothetical protein C0J52_28231 [Blattella germanica]|nr:hypothetical protein C0J52_28231 [Blattella germanica]
MNYTIERSWGILKNGTWDGLTGVLARHEADIGLTPLFILKERTHIVTFIASSKLQL